MDTIVFLGCKKSGSSRDALKAAFNMGYSVCVLTNNLQQYEDRSSYPEVSHMYYLDLNDITEVRFFIKQLKKQNSVRAIVSFVDPYCGLAAKLARENWVESFSSDAMFIMHNKLKSRLLLNETPYNPKYFVISQENLHQYDQEIAKMLPVVVKYVESNGSKDVYFCNTMEEYENYSYKILNTYEDATIIVEGFLDGPQVIVEVLAINNQINIIAIVEQEIKLINHHFIITGYNLKLDYSKEYYNKLKDTVEEILEYFDFEHGPCHLEMRYINEQWKLIEINPRISGAGMNQFLLTGLGINLVQETLKLALGKDVNLHPKFKKNTFAEYIILEEEGLLERVTGRNQVMNSPGVQFVYIKPKKGTTLIPPISLGNRYAFVIATGDNEEEAKLNAKNAAKKIVFHLK